MAALMSVSATGNRVTAVDVWWVKLVVQLYKPKVTEGMSCTKQTWQTQNTSSQMRLL